MNALSTHDRQGKYGGLAVPKALAQAFRQSVFDWRVAPSAGLMSVDATLRSQPL